MIDILFLAHNRLEYTRASIDALLKNTSWDRVRSVWVYDDASSDGTAEFLSRVKFPVTQNFCEYPLGGPVAVMNEFINTREPDGFVKVDNDLILCPNWLDALLAASDMHPRVDLIGIEPRNYHVKPAVKIAECARVSHAEFIGGIGLMQGRVFAKSRPVADGRFGFTKWQTQHPEIQKAWLDPPMPVFLLDHLPFEPWLTLGKEYLAKGWQRKQWDLYTPKWNVLWAWWR